MQAACTRMRAHVLPKSEANVKACNSFPCTAPGIHLQVALKAVFLGRRDLTPQQRGILASEAKFLRMVRNTVKCALCVRAH